MSPVVVITPRPPRLAPRARPRRPSLAPLARGCSPRSPGPLVAVVAACLAAASALCTPLAAANGRFPAAGQIAPHPQDPARFVVRTTFGLLSSSDAGANFDWVCEQAVGLTSDQDPQVALFGDGTVAVAPFEGVAASRDGGCSFALSAVQGKGASMIDVSVCRSKPSHAVTVSWSAKTKATSVHATDDAGLSWSLVSTLVDTDFVPQTIDVAPGAPGVVLISGAFSTAGGLRGVVFRSVDGAATFARSEVDFQGETGLYLAAIHPSDPSRVFARTSGGPADRLLASTDGGATFAEIAKTKGPMLGFALSPDGATLAIGGPDDGVLVSPVDPPAFAPAWPSPVSCLAWSSGGLLACGPDGAPFAVGLSTDGGASFSPLLPSLAATRGPLACPADSPVTTQCVPLWEAQKSMLPGAAGANLGGAAGAAGAMMGGVGGVGVGGVGVGGVGVGGVGVGGSTSAGDAAGASGAVAAVTGAGGASAGPRRGDEGEQGGGCHLIARGPSSRTIGGAMCLAWAIGFTARRWRGQGRGQGRGWGRGRGQGRGQGR